MATRIASVSGLRGIVGDGLDPADAVRFAAAYASGREPGPIVVGHDGRPTAATFLHAVLAGVTATGHDVLLAGPVATPTLGRLVADRGAVGGIQISASHNPPAYNGLKFFQPAGMVLGPADGKAVLARFEAGEFAWAAWDRIGKVHPIDDPDAAHLARVLMTVDVLAIRSRRFTVALDACHGAGGRMGEALLRDLGCTPIILGGMPDGRYDHPPEPTAANLKRFAAIVQAAGAAVGFAQDPDADRLAIVDETGRYIGEELTLALAASHRLRQEKGPVVLNLSTSRTTEDVAAHFGCPVLRTPVGEIHVVERMRSRRGRARRRGQRRRHRPAGRVRPRQLRRDGPGSRPARRDGRAPSRLVDALPRYAMVKDSVPADGAGDPGSPISRTRSRRAIPRPTPTATTASGSTGPSAWAHVRASNTEPIVRVIAEARESAQARDLADRLGRLVASGGREP